MQQASNWHMSFLSTSPWLELSHMASRTLREVGIYLTCAQEKGKMDFVTSYLYLHLLADLFAIRNGIIFKIFLNQKFEHNILLSITSQWLKIKPNFLARWMKPSGEDNLLFGHTSSPSVLQKGDAEPSLCCVATQANLALSSTPSVFNHP